jgi:hypothetical protein
LTPVFNSHGFINRIFHPRLITLFFERLYAFGLVWVLKDDQLGRATTAGRAEEVAEGTPFRFFCKAESKGGRLD